MTRQDVLRELEKLGTAQNRKVYKRHGVASSYGVSYANLTKMRKKINVDHELARKLWSSKNHDARILATMIVDPAKMDGRQIDSWAKDLSNYVIMDAFVAAVSRTRFAETRMKKWHKSKDEFIGGAGWQLLSYLAMNDERLPDTYFTPYLKIIERDIHSRKNRVRHSMNGALISIGARNEKLEKKALSVAKKIGKVEVDHGETNCKTPDALDYIPKAAAHRRRKRASGSRV